MAVVGFDPKRAINGKFGKAWVNDSLWAEVTGVSAKAKTEKTKVPMCGRLSTQFKFKEVSYTGTINLVKIYSRTALLIAEDLKRGVSTPINIIVELNDPDSYGAERVVLKNCMFDEITIIEFDAEKDVTKENLTFSYEDFEFLDTIGIGS